LAAAVALTGKFRDPRELGTPPKFSEPDHYPVSDSMIIPPPSDREKVTIHMGPNIKPLPPRKPLSDSLSLKVVFKGEDNLSTDDILPGGAKVLPLRSNLPVLAEHVFKRHDPQFVSRAKAFGSSIIVGGDNYGQGSSREHAALAPGYLGVQAVLAISIARLHRANLINFGVLPILISQEDYHKIEQGDLLECENVRSIVAKDDRIMMRLSEKGVEIEGLLELSLREREVLLAGGRLNYMKNILVEKGKDG